MIKLTKEQILEDYKLSLISRHASLTGRREVLTGKAKFGIFGDGKELAQVALAHFFRNGDWRSGYYRDQTFMLATGMLTLEHFFAQLYGDTNPITGLVTGGRMMNNHFATKTIDDKGNSINHTLQPNSSADISPTAGQMPRLLGLALASKLYRMQGASESNIFSINGNEIALGTIGDASTSEGLFFEAINAAGVMQIPLAMVVYDDGYGISVPNKYQTTKGSISEVLSGFEKNETSNGFKIFKVEGWNYSKMLEIFEEGFTCCRLNHTPVVFHITELTQPQGHSTSGSHERYKSADRLAWEQKFDCIQQMKAWILDQKLATEEELAKIENESIEVVKDCRKKSWEYYLKPIKEMRSRLIELSNVSTCNCAKTNKINTLIRDTIKIAEPTRKDIISTAKKILRLMCQTCNPNKPLKKALTDWIAQEVAIGSKLYCSHLYSNSNNSALNISTIPQKYSENKKNVAGREILLANHDYNLSKYPELVIFGEDVGKIGGVNQTYEGLQEKYGEHRIFDTGIREATIIGQGIGLALRGFKVIAEIQYFDYLLYALQVISDDLATLRYRTNGNQKAPLIISTRGHRLEGIWHSGSPLSMVINSIRGIYVLVPRNMTQAAGFYNSMLQSDDPALIIEPLNGYRLKESMPKNIGNFTIPLGIPEVLISGSDITIVTYGSCVRIAEDAVNQLKEFNISCELIDVQTLIPFDINQIIADSIKKTNKVLFFDEDVPGGATAYMMQKVIEEQSAFKYLDFEPKTLTAKDHRAAYGTDGDYFSNPNAEDVFEVVYDMMHQYNPNKYPLIY